MDDRLYLHTKLEEALPDLEAYYQPPGNVILVRPCMIYEQLRYEPSHANNLPYVVGTRYKVTVLSDLPGIDAKPLLAMDGVTVEDNRAFVTEDIVHNVFTVSVNSI